MKPTKKQIAEVSQMAAEMNANIDRALSHLNNCSISIFKAIGAKGVVEASIETINREIDLSNGGINLNRCSIEKETEKAYLLLIPKGIDMIQKWVAKSVIVNNLVPTWVLR